MFSNRSLPPGTVIPVLNHPDVAVAADALCEAFGFTIRVRIGNHRTQIKAGDGYMVLAEGSVPADNAHPVMVRVPDADSHHHRAWQHGACILTVPTDHPYGERQYSAKDFAGHQWTFTQSGADVAPEEWGSTSVALE